MSKRADALAWIRIAAYHGDAARATRLFIENRISRTAYDEAMAKGRAQRAGGVKCHCTDCQGTERAA
jgi:hypothetical protein